MVLMRRRLWKIWCWKLAQTSDLGGAFVKLQGIYQVLHEDSTLHSPLVPHEWAVVSCMDADTHNLLILSLTSMTLTYFACSCCFKSHAVHFCTLMNVPSYALFSLLVPFNQ